MALPQKHGLDDDDALVKELQELGLSKKEAQVYLALLPHPLCGTSLLIKNTRLHGQFVYGALGRLEELGLAKHVIQNGRKKFSANPPERILSILEEKKVMAGSVARSLAARMQPAVAQDFDVLQGETAFRAYELEILAKLPQGSCVDIIGGAGDRYLALFGEEASTYERIRLEKDISVRYIGSVAQRPALEVLSQGRKSFEYRLFPGLSSSIVNTNIYPDRVILNVFGSPVLSMSLTNTVAAQGYREFFDSLWGMAERNMR